LPAPDDTGHPSFVNFWPEYLMPSYFLPQSEFENNDYIKHREAQQAKDNLKQRDGEDDELHEFRVNRSKERAPDPWNTPIEHEAGWVLAGWIVLCVIAQIIYFFFIIIISYYSFRLLFYRFLWLSVTFPIKKCGRYLYVKVS